MHWYVLGRSVRGATHIRKGLPNQDCIGWWPEDSSGPTVVLAVADGHGSARSFRSATGARLAVQAAVDVVRQFLEGQEGATALSSVKRTAEERMPQALVQKWVEAVETDLAQSPLTADELDGLERGEGMPARQSVEENPRISYGSTLLVAVLTETYLMALQLGDGDILTVSEDGQVSRPLPGDPRLLGNETTSLCLNRAWDEFRFGFQVLTERQPAMVLLSTDGLANSYSDPAGFLKFGSDLWATICADGVDAVAERMAEWLTETTMAGSGDDITLGLAVRREALSPAAPDVIPEPGSNSEPTDSSSGAGSASNVPAPRARAPYGAVGACWDRRAGRSVLGFLKGGSR